MILIHDFFWAFLKNKDGEYLKYVVSVSSGGDMSELNAHTYVYQPEKSLQGFTIEVGD